MRERAMSNLELLETDEGWTVDGWTVLSVDGWTVAVPEAGVEGAREGDISLRRLGVQGVRDHRRERGGDQALEGTRGVAR